MTIDLQRVIKERRSVREFTVDPVSELDVMTIIEAGIWAPSAKNNQPWKFVCVQDSSVRALLSEYTVYSTILAQCQALIGVYIDKALSLDEIQDQQSVGAVVQNMLLTADNLGLGAVWLGEVRKNAGEFNKELGISFQYELAAMLAIGYPAHRNQKSHRKTVNDFILKNIGG